MIVQRCIVEDAFDRVVKEGLLWVSFSAVEVLLLESQWFLDDTIHWRGARRN